MPWIAWGLVLAVLVQLTLVGMAGTARAAAAVEAAGPGLGGWAALGVFFGYVFLARYWRPRALRYALAGTAPEQRKALRFIGWCVVTFFMAALLLPSMVLAAEEAAGQGGGYVAMAVLNLWHFAINLIYAVVAISVLFAVLRFRDRLLGVSFRGNRGILSVIHRSGVATAIYYGVWILAGALIVSRAFA